MENVPASFVTDRLNVDPLVLTDDVFIMELVNTKGWIEFIGNRNVNSLKDAADYIRKILTSPNVVYWIVKLNNNSQPIGAVTLIKRNYLDHHDIGFAFLPEHSGKGYAFESASELLKKVIYHPDYSTILATTVPGNVNSIRLLEKLGLHYEKEIDADGEKLLVYKITLEEFQLKSLTTG